MDSETYEALVREAIGALPDHLRGALKDVLIIIEDNQPPDRPGILLGLYEGVPLPAWGRDYSGKLPDKITLYRASIERVAGTPERIPAIVRETTWHEIGHYFGLNHTQIHKMEERWRAGRR